MKKEDNHNQKCDFEGCPGRREGAKMRLIWSPRYLFVHPQCVPFARKASRERHESFGFRLGI